MARNKNRGRAGRQSQRWLSTSLSESANSLTETLTALELDAHQSSPTRSDGFDVGNDEDSLVDEPGPDSSDDEEFESEEAAVNEGSATVAQQVDILFGINST